ncbi:DnaJ domain-containing protein [Paenibacillus lautus]|uniref:DnaJ domain-containing protein n=1 Tax=Paenibacillus lautus TaxID=1401 RepID=UPI002DB7B256|nr:lysozyme inhibitor LprI family protein [Paenibacillus lautus]MEC0259346.1 DnaJ domain-containing protein [Paenibacillus lautus]
MAIPRYKGIQSIAKIASWFLKHDKMLTNRLWDDREARKELNQWLTLLFQNHQQSEINEAINTLFHEYTYLSLPQLEKWQQNNIVPPEEQKDYLNLMTLVIFQSAQLRISGWIYQQIFKIEFTPFGNPFLILECFDGFVDYYKVLGLPITCTSEDIKRAFRKKAKTLHPDAGGDPEAFKLLKEAYDVLTDEQKKDVYDEKYTFYQKRYDYDIKSSQMESNSTFTLKKGKPRFVIRFRWKAYVFVISCVLLYSILYPLIEKFNDTAPATTMEKPESIATTKQNPSTEPLGTEQESNIEQVTAIEQITTSNLKVEYLEKLDNIEKGLADLDNLYKDGITSEMIESESETYNRWNDALNEIYGVLKDQLSNDAMNKIREEQRQWIVYRDDIARAESLEFKGGTMESLQYTSTQARLTKERCFELVQNYMPELSEETNIRTSFTEAGNSVVFTLGSNKDEVLKVMGEPDEKEEFGNVSSWRYQDSYIEFDENKKVAGWSNYSKVLRVTVGSKQEGAPPFRKGSSKEDVVHAMGTPDEVTHWGLIWHYQNSFVEFDGESVTGWSDESGILLVK